MTLQHITLITSIFFITSCTVSDPTYTRAGTDSTVSSDAYQQCLYQAELATANTGALPPKYNGKINDAVSSGIADGISRGYEQANLIDHCMKIQGYKKSL
ncbi:hypothetical protein A1QC_09600 [Vibrio rumoiensis 1S-45]|uniref:Uncharacterized protein n=1 Tax=Vibrio rumoiensis 1S-45 TaxID=1188252 RepID=A0A1E5E1K6_9VIBR|nr:hypothetical protein A1QC_09600 [Vibrio rumoiensis 1S-45]